MKLLISPTTLKEAKIVANSKADIVDIKNVKEGSLGAQLPSIIKEVKKILPKQKEFSIAIGDANYKPGSIGLSALGAVAFNPNYIKIGLLDIKNYQNAREVAESFVKSVKLFSDKIKCVVAGYADYRRFGGIPVDMIPKISSKADASVAMLDTAIKDGRGLFDVLSVKEIKKFISMSKNVGLEVSLAGSVKESDLERLYYLGVDIVGIRGAACKDSDRNNPISKIRLDKLCGRVKSLK